jgi:uncharacterized protein YecE (DUF72 family)
MLPISFSKNWLDFFPRTNYHVRSAEKLESMDIRIGCCGFPVAREKYFQQFNVVEIQQTFYQPPRYETALKWRATAPPEFEFTLKAWQLITHPPTSPTYRRLKETITNEKKRHYGFFCPTEEVFTAWEETARIARVLATRVIIFQCPSSFTPTDEHLENMYLFFSSIERIGFSFIWEPRGLWPEDTIKKICEELKLIHCVDPFKNEPVSGVFTYLRLHGKDGYHYRYTDEELNSLTEKVNKRKHLTYVMFNKSNMFDDARRFRALLPHSREVRSASKKRRGREGK